MIIWWKEIRSILPLWVALLLAMIIPGLLGMRPFGEPVGEWLLVVLVAGGAGLAAVAYGREFHNRTMLWRLVLPEGRMTMLTRKFVVLAVALASLIGLCAALEPRLLTAHDVLASVLVLAVLALTSTCLISVVLRNMLATLVLTFAIPVVVMILLVTVMEPLSRWLRLEPEIVALGSLFLYSLATGVAAVPLWRRMELRSDTVVASEFDVTWSRRSMGDSCFRHRPAWWTSLRKEIGLLRFVFWITAIFVLTAAAYSAAALLHYSWIAEPAAASSGVLPIYSYADRSRDVILMLGVLAFLSQLVLVPALCGGLAFAEEAYFGTHAWQLTQPVSPARRWLIKFAAASGLNILAGLLLPVGFYLLLFTVLPKGYLVWDDIIVGEWDQVLPQLLGGHLLTFAFSAWCGSWSRSTAGALAKASLMILGLVMLVRLAFEVYGHGGPIDWRVTAVATSVAALVMTFSNLRLPEVPARQCAIQFLALALVATIASFLYADYLTGRFLSDFLNGP